MTAIAYVRRSSGKEAKVGLNIQREAVHQLARARGDTIARTFEDLGQSGGKANRPGYMDMLEAIDADGIHAVYAYDADRLARDIVLFAGLLNLARARGFRIYTGAGELTDEDERTVRLMEGVMADGELSKITKRNRGNRDARMARGDDMGVRPYGYRLVTSTGKRERYDLDGPGAAPLGTGAHRVGDKVPKGAMFYRRDADAIAPVLDAYRQTGTYNGAARILNERGVRTVRQLGLLERVQTTDPDELEGDDRDRYEALDWHAASVRSVVRREARELIPEGTSRGRRPGEGRPRLFRGLLRCHCGALMSPGGAVSKPRYYCAVSSRTPGHPLPHGIAERKLRPWIEAEAANVRAELAVMLEVPGDDYDDSDDRRRLDAARDLIGEESYSEAIARLDATKDAQGERMTELHKLPEAIDWEHDDTQATNDVLRAYWTHVQLGADLLPVEAPRRFDTPVN